MGNFNGIASLTVLSCCQPLVHNTILRRKISLCIINEMRQDCIQNIDNKSPVAISCRPLFLRRAVLLCSSVPRGSGCAQLRFDNQRGGNSAHVGWGERRRYGNQAILLRGSVDAFKQGECPSYVPCSPQRVGCQTVHPPTHPPTSVRDD